MFFLEVWYVPNDVGYLEVESHVVEKKIIFQVEMLPNPRNDPTINAKRFAIFVQWVMSREKQVKSLNLYGLLKVKKGSDSMYK